MDMDRSKNASIITVLVWRRNPLWQMLYSILLRMKIEEERASADGVELPELQPEMCEEAAINADMAFKAAVTAPNESYAESFADVEDLLDVEGQFRPKYLKE